MKIQKFIIILLTTTCAISFVNDATAQTITRPPAELNLHPFYKKYINVNGIHLISSHRVPDSALVAAFKTLDALTGFLPKEVLKAMTDLNTRVGVMARYEGTTDIPEHAFLANDTTLNWDVRARGLGGDRDLPMSTCAEENILAYQIDKYHAEDIMIHEFAHSIHLIALIHVYPDFNERLQKSLDAAISQGKWENTYAATNVAEYWAEGVQTWFNVNAEVPVPDGKHNQVNTREELRTYDKGLFDILSEFFPETEESISRHKYVNNYTVSPR
jgi:alpha-glucosidase